MNLSPHLQNEIKWQVREEIARKEYSPGLMAIAVARAQGDKTQINDLYLRLRCAELGLLKEKQILVAKGREQKQGDAGTPDETISKSKLRWPETAAAMDCPHCDYHGTMVVRSRRTPLVLWLTCLTSPMFSYTVAEAIADPNAVYLMMPIPILLYLLMVRGYKAMCPACSALVKDHVPLPEQRAIDEAVGS